MIEPVLTMFRFRQIKPEFLNLYEDFNNGSKEIENKGEWVNQETLN